MRAMLHVRSRLIHLAAPLLGAALALGGCGSSHARKPADAAVDAPPDSSTRPSDGGAESSVPMDAAVLPDAVSSANVGFLNIPNLIPPYEYGPAIVLENGVYYVFYCSSSDTPPHPYDAIRLTTSTTGAEWTSPTVALAAGGRYAAASVCDPSVVKFRGQYFLYHTCINGGPPDDIAPPDGYLNNRICVAMADNIAGPYRLYDAPIIQDLDCPHSPASSYCVGQPAALVWNDEVYVYYTNHRPGDPDPGPGNIFLRKSGNGITFGPVENDGQPIWNRRNVDVKRDRVSGLFFLVQGEVDTVEIPWATSADGVHFTPFDPSRVLTTNHTFPDESGRNHNPGIASDAEGAFGGMSFVVYGSTYGVAHTFDWHLYRSNFIINPAESDCSGCVADSCDRGCSVTAGAARIGHCAAPGSLDPGQCCACELPPQRADCSACTEGCVAACEGASFDVGVCANPGSSDPDTCCGCY